MRLSARRSTEAPRRSPSAVPERADRRRDPTGREVDHREALDLLDLGQDLEQPFGDRVEVLVGEDDVGFRDAGELAVGAADLLEEYRVAVRKLRSDEVELLLVLAL